MIKRVKWARCTSHAPSVVHLSVTRPRRGKWWHHLEHMGPARFERMRNGSSSLTQLLLEIANEMRTEGEWSRAFEYMRIVVDAEVNPMEVGTDSHITFHNVSANTANPAGPLGFHRLDPDRTPIRTDDVTQVVFFATNSVDLSDERLLRLYRDQLAGSTVLSQLWLLLMVSPDGPQPFVRASADAARSPAATLGLPVFMWSERALHQRLPTLSDAINRSLRTLALEIDANHARYYYYHAALVLWHQVCGADFPRLQYLWRLEPDVVFSGDLATLLQVSARANADLLLPAYWCARLHLLLRRLAPALTYRP